MYHEIKTKQDIHQFMHETVYYFHDSCIKEMHYVSGAYMTEKGMYPLNDKRILRVTIQTAIAGIEDVELEFSDLVYLKLFPLDEHYTCEIFGASLFLKDGCFIFCENDDIPLEDVEDYEGIVICAKKLRWRCSGESKE